MRQAEPRLRVLDGGHARLIPAADFWLFATNHYGNQSGEGIPIEV